MLNRRILRIKAFKILYSYSISGSYDLNESLVNLEKSCEATRDLYLFMLAIISPLTIEAQNRIEAMKMKFNPDEKEIDSNYKFANNKLAPIFQNDPDFTKLIKRKKLDWDGYDILIRKLYDSIRSKKYFLSYINSSETSLMEDIKLFIKIYENEFVDNSEIEEMLEDKSIFWVDDLAYSLTFCCKTLKIIGKTGVWTYPELYQSDMIKKKDSLVQMDSDKAFVVKLFTTAYSGYGKYFDMIVKEVPDWDKDRLFSVDITLIILCLAEIDAFPDLDSRISLNEYIEISKYYSTPKSRKFVNGLLHKLVFDNLNK